MTTQPPKTEDPIADALELSESIDLGKIRKDQIQQHLITASDAIVASPIRQIADNDLEEARRNITSMMEKNNEAIEGLLELALASEAPKAYEALSQLIRAGVEASEKLIQLHKLLSETRKIQLDTEIARDDTQSQGSNGKTVNQQAIFVGSTKELMDLIGARKQLTSGESTTPIDQTKE